MFGNLSPSSECRSNHGDKVNVSGLRQSIIKVTIYPHGFRFANTRPDLLDLPGLERFVFDQDSKVDPREVKIVRCQEVRVTREL